MNVEYTVRITEVRKTYVTVESNSMEAAKKTARERWEADKRLCENERNHSVTFEALYPDYPPLDLPHQTIKWKINNREQVASHVPRRKASRNER